MSPRRRESEPGPTHASALAEALRVSILSGELGLDAPLREERLAEDYAASRHTVRAALQALAAERLVAIAPYRGARVANLDEIQREGGDAVRAHLAHSADLIRAARYQAGSDGP